MAPASVHVVDDDESLLRAITRLLRASSFAERTFDSATGFLAAPLHEVRGCVISDLQKLQVQSVAELTRLCLLVGETTSFVWEECCQHPASALRRRKEISPAATGSPIF